MLSLRPLVFFLVLASSFDGFSKSNELIRKLKIVEIEQKLDNISQSKKTLNDVELLHLGKKSFLKRINIIKNAKNFIYHSIPYWHDDEKGNEIYQAFVDKKEKVPEINLKLIVDWSSNLSVQDPFGKRIFKRISKVFDHNLLRWNHPSWLRPWSLKLSENHIHEKILIVDGESLILGGMNNGSSYYNSGRMSWHDTDVYINGPAALEGSKTFLKMYALGNYLKNYKNKIPLTKKKRIWLFQKSIFPGSQKINFPSLRYKVNKKRMKLESTIRKSLEELEKYEYNFKNEKKTPVRLIYDNPLFDYKIKNRLKKFNKTIETVEFLLKHTKEEVMFAIPYLTISENFKNLLIKAAKSGIKVKILTNSLLSMDYVPELMHNAMTYSYKDLLKNGVHIYEWQGHKAFETIEKKYDCDIPENEWPGFTVHSKLALFDRQVAMVSSHNFNLRSEKFNSEVTALIEDINFSKQLYKIFHNAFDNNKKNRRLKCGQLSLDYPELTKLVKFVDIKEKFKIGRRFKLKIPFLLKRYL